MDLALFAIVQLLVLAALAATVGAAGALAARFLDPGGGSPAGSPAGFRLALGFALLCQVLLWLGFLGQLRPAAIVGILVLLHLAAWRWGRPPSWPAPPGGRAALLLAAALVAPVFVLALYPPLGFDQTLYHLPFSRAFAETGGLPFLGELRFPVFPQLVEVLQAAVWLLAGEIATQQVGLLALGACLALLWAWTREKAGAEAGFFAVALVFGSPCAVYLATCGYLEPALGLLILGALYAAERAAAGPAGWPVAAGFLAGSAAATKYHGLFFLAATALVLLRPGPWRGSARKLLLYGAAALVAAGPSYARIYGHTGNPLFPFYAEIFGSGPWTEEALLPRGSERIERVATLLFDISFRREAVGSLPPYTPLFLLALPMALFALWRWPDLRKPAAVAVAFLLVSPTHGHYFVAVAPLWALVLGAGSARLFAGAPARRRALAVAAVLVALGGPAYAIYRIGLLGPPPGDAAGRDRLLAAQLPAYAAILYLGREAPEGRVFAAGPELARLTSYYDGTLMGDVNGMESVYRVEARARQLGSLASALDEIGAGFALIGGGETGWLDLAEGDRRLERVFRDSGATVYRLRTTAARGS